MLKICQLSTNARTVSCFLICRLCCMSKPGLSKKKGGPLISLNNGRACVDLIPLASSAPLMVSLSLRTHCIKAPSAFHSQHLPFFSVRPAAASRWQILRSFLPLTTSDPFLSSLPTSFVSLLRPATAMNLTLRLLWVFPLLTCFESLFNPN